jgi:hypothetical protein
MVAKTATFGAGKLLQYLQYSIGWCLLCLGGQGAIGEQNNFSSVILESLFSLEQGRLPRVVLDLWDLQPRKRTQSMLK